ncbi:sulfur carrier protein ThiS adenylyltransferase ThiF [Pediococcus acidilactici]|uniref:sulfur carrier protein ThiS adenylyltransferase ThiF n=1 Tax=Pediococcus acidilactici TaxID=1254 RepID=UPI0018698A4F|nr:sulfur carrier protein ThiS adenylyltransferase ThiF [Pediococcus acidilactici]MCH9266836.1 sulfur carrier protein ThiS adenylyltransferase ThiF [Pediococcus acidilactici]MCK2073722.1 sulfur carrier protein ThiS adenylyltransferase ThiF [Pediococcus acidilactici]QOP72761.1 sulfur carrier protein ThiS adenylyltransferase ThiF [Pediococcus acidilactici]
MSNFKEKQLQLYGHSITDLQTQMTSRNVAHSALPLSSSKVTIAGAGGLGSNIAIALARIGIGHLTLVDFDQVELSNLNRQQYKLNQIGMAKVIALKQNIEEFNPFISVTPLQVTVNAANVADLFADADVICEAFDDPAAKTLLLRECSRLFPQKPLVMASGMAGIHPANQIKTKQINQHVYVAGDGVSSGQEGLMAPRVMVAAGHQANQIVRLILGNQAD